MLRTRSNDGTFMSKINYPTWRLHQLQNESIFLYAGVCQDSVQNRNQQNLIFFSGHKGE